MVAAQQHVGSTEHGELISCVLLHRSYSADALGTAAIALAFSKHQGRPCLSAAEMLGHSFASSVPAFSSAEEAKAPPGLSLRRQGTLGSLLVRRLDLPESSLHPQQEVTSPLLDLVFSSWPCHANKLGPGGVRPGAGQKPFAYAVV